MEAIFKDQWALILGGSSGIGQACAEKLAAHGMNLVIVHRNRKSDEEKISTLFDSLRAKGITLISYNDNALDEQVRKKIVQEIKQKLGDKKISCLLHSVAKGNLKKLVDDKAPVLEKIDFDITIHAMATSWWEWTKELIDQELWAENASNMSFTSEGNTKCIPYYGAVSAAKSTLETLSRYMAVELAPLGIRSNIIQSGVVETPSLLMIPESENLIRLSKKRNPFKRLTQTADIANVVYLLCQPEAQWINGALIKADGGESLL